MTKARFDEKQQAVTITTIGKENYFQICLNEQEVQEQSTQESNNPVATTMYEYDFNSWHDHTTDPDSVKEEPEKYLLFVPFDNLPQPIQEESTNDRLAALEASQEETAQALQELIMSQMEA